MRSVPFFTGALLCFCLLSLVALSYEVNFNDISSFSTRQFTMVEEILDVLGKHIVIERNDDGKFEVVKTTPAPPSSNNPTSNEKGSETSNPPNKSPDASKHSSTKDPGAENKNDKDHGQNKNEKDKKKNEKDNKKPIDSNEKNPPSDISKPVPDKKEDSSTKKEEEKIKEKKDPVSKPKDPDAPRQEEDDSKKGVDKETKSEEPFPESPEWFYHPKYHGHHEYENHGSYVHDKALHHALRRFLHLTKRTFGVHAFSHASSDKLAECKTPHCIFNKSGFSFGPF